MITFLKGRLVEKNPTQVIVECNGVGYLLHISLNTFSQVSDDESIMIYTHLQVKEDSHTLFGFSSTVERDVFRLLISVSGIGASIARTMLSSMTPAQIVQAISHEDIASIQAIKGIGAKTAQRTIIELKDKVIGIEDTDQSSLKINNTFKDEALSALEVLGFSRKAAGTALDHVLKVDPNLKVETLIKEALKRL
jgi:Holliday junction DNA helicase RuvA